MDILQFLSDNLYLFLILVLLFMFLYIMGGEDIVFFRKKKYNIDDKGGEKLVNALNKFSRIRDFEVMGPTQLTFEDKTMSFDRILLCYRGTIAFMNCPLGGDIYGDNNSVQWVQIFGGDRKSFDAPTTALNGSVKFFKDIYRAEKVKGGQVEGLVVFTNKDANVAVSKSFPVCTLANLPSLLSSAKYLTDNGADIPAMKAALEKYKK